MVECRQYTLKRLNKKCPVLLDQYSNPRTACAGQFVSRSFVVLLRKSNPQNYNLQTAVVRGVIRHCTVINTQPKFKVWCNLHRGSRSERQTNYLQGSAVITDNNDYNL